MMGERSPEDLARETDPFRLRVLGTIRKMIVRFAAKGLWELGGFSKLGERIPKAEVFQGVGFWATPAAGVEVEAVVLNVGGDANHPIVVALRDEKTRKQVADALAGDTTCVHNTAARVVILPNGTIEARTHGGTAAPLATLADLQALRDFIATGLTMTVDPVLNIAGPGSTVPVPDPVGTTKLKGE